MGDTAHIDTIFKFCSAAMIRVLKAWIIAAVKNIDASMLTRVWQELEYRIDVCRVILGPHRTSLVIKKKLRPFSCSCEQFH
jgi:hypothetical protein